MSNLIMVWPHECGWRQDNIFGVQEILISETSKQQLELYCMALPSVENGLGFKFWLLAGPTSSHLINILGSCDWNIARSSFSCLISLLGIKLTFFGGYSTLLFRSFTTVLKQDHQLTSDLLVRFPIPFLFLFPCLKEEELIYNNYCDQKHQKNIHLKPAVGSLYL